MSESNDIFNLSADSLINPPKKKSSDIYQPGADKGKDGVYKAIIRFLPNVKDPKKSKIMKYYVWMVDPVTGESYSVDCPSTVGKKSILKDTYWKLKNSTSVRDQELAQERFGRAESYYSFVQIVKDPNDPDMEGKVMVFKFGSKINQKIEALLKPVVGTPTNPYDVFEGKLFALHITKKQKWNNFDLCEFVGDKTALVIDGKPLEKTDEDRQRVITWLTTNETDLGRYEYKEWTSELEEKVKNSIRNIIPDAKLVEQLISGASTTSESNPSPKAAFNPEPKAKSPLDIETPKTEKAEPKKEAAKKTVSSMDDLYDNL